MRGRRVLLLGMAALVLVGVLGLPWTLPPLVRWAVIRQARATLGRDVALAWVTVDPWRLRVAAGGLHVAGRDGGPPLLTVERVDSRLRLPELLRGRVRLLANGVRVEAPSLHVVRRPDGTLDADDVLARLAGPPAAPAAPGRGPGLDVTLADLLVDRGQVVLEDRAASPPATWALRDLRIALDQLSTRPGAPPGMAEVSATLNGAPLRASLADLRLGPAGGRATATLEGLDLQPAWSYVPAGAVTRPAGGTLTARLQAEHGAGGPTRLAAEVTVAEPRVVREGSAGPLVSAPALTVTVGDLARHHDGWRLGRLEVAAEPTVALDGSEPLTVRPLRLVLEHLPLGPGAPGRLALAAGLPGGATLDVTGALALLPPAATADLVLAGLDLTLLRRFLPPDAVITPARGRLGARLALRHGDGAALRATGHVLASDLVLDRRGQAVPFATHREVRIDLDDAAWAAGGAGGLTASHVTVTGAPRIVDAGPSPPVVTAFRRLRLDADDVHWPAGPPARVHLAGATEDGATLAVRGTFHPATLATRVRLEAAGVDLAPLAAYVPPDAPVRPARGRLGLGLTLAYDPPTLGISGTLAALDLALARAGQAEPLSHHPRLDVGVRDLTLRGGDLAVGRITLAGAPTLVDASVSPPVRVTFDALDLGMEGFSWPARGPARVLVEAAADGGRGTLRGTFHPGTLAADVEARLSGLDLTPAGGYLRLRHDRATGVRLDGDAALAGLRLLRRGGDGAPPPAGGPEPLLVADERLAIRVDDLGWHDGTLRVARLRVTGAPTVADGSGDAGRQVRLPALALSAEAVRVPGDAPGRVALAAELPGSGTLAVTGTLAPDGRAADLRVTLAEAALAPWAGWLPIAAPLAGVAGADLQATLDLRGEVPVDASGALRLRDLRLGAPDRPPVTVASIEVEGLAARWPREVAIERVAVAGVRGLVERERDGTLPLRRLLAPRRPGPEPPEGPATPAGPAASAPASAGPPGPPPAATPAGPEPGPRPPRLVVRVGEIALDDGAVRFVDRTAEPLYSEELDRLALRVRGLASGSPEPARVEVQGVLGNTAALELAGEVAPFATPFVLDLQGELREFPLPRTNPMFRRLFAWLLTRGSLTTRVHYRIVGDQLDARNRVEVRRLDVERDRAPRPQDDRLSLPLGLIVALATDSRGDIAFDLPVKGRLGSPELSLGGAIWAALRNLLANVVTGPFQAIGGLVSRGEGEPAEVRLDPVPFAAGSAVLDAEGERHVQKVADVLRASPRVGLVLRPALSAADLLSLRTREVTARIQSVQRAEGLPSFAAAAERVFRQALPGEAPPEAPEAIVEALRQREPAPQASAGELAARRVEAARQAFVDRAGIEPDRLRVAGAAPPPAETGGVALELAP
jgi:hypothetical protein